MRRMRSSVTAPAVPQAAELAFNSRAAAVRRRVYEKAGGGQIMFT